jgi:hypothetical protein
VRDQHSGNRNYVRPLGQSFWLFRQACSFVRAFHDARRSDLFTGLRRLLALSQTLALSYPIKKWSALLAIAGAIFYDIATGSRVGTERALYIS